MVDAAAVRSPLTDQQLRDAVRAIALRYLTVERGHRRIDVLRPVLSWRALDAEFAKPKHREPRAAGQRPPGTADVGGVWLDRRGEHADAAVLIRDGDRPMTHHAVAGPVRRQALPSCYLHCSWRSGGGALYNHQSWSTGIR